MGDPSATPRPVQHLQECYFFLPTYWNANRIVLGINRSRRRYTDMASKYTERYNLGP